MPTALTRAGPVEFIMETRRGFGVEWSAIVERSRSAAMRCFSVWIAERRHEENDTIFLLYEQH